MLKNDLSPSLILLSIYSGVLQISSIANAQYVINGEIPDTGYHGSG